MLVQFAKAKLHKRKASVAFRNQRHQRALSRNDLRHDILRILNLEDTPKAPSAFAIERWRVAIFASAVFLYIIPCWSIGWLG
jgi:hypothetical protein